MFDNRKVVFIEYLDASIQNAQEEEKKLTLEERKDEANFIKVKINIYNVFKTVFTVVANNKKFGEEEVKADFIKKMETIPENWKKSYEIAKLHNDVEKILIEEIKLQTLEEIRGKFTQIWEG